METTKRCSKCKVEKPLSEFHKDSRQPLGVGAWCRQCKGVKGTDRFTLPTIKPEVWLATYCVQTTCLRCGTSENVNLYRNGAIEKPLSIADAKDRVRMGEVFCHHCASVPMPLNMKLKIKIKRRFESIEERINETDFLAERAAQLRSRKFLRGLAIESEYLHDEVVDAYTKRHLSKEKRKDLDERLPVITEASDKTYRSKFVAAYADDPCGNDFEES